MVRTMANNMLANMIWDLANRRVTDCVNALCEEITKKANLMADKESKITLEQLDRILRECRK